MEGPEQLESEPPRLRRGTWWAVLGVVVAVVAGLTVVRVTGPDETPAPVPGRTSPASGASSPPGTDWPVGLASGTLFVAAGGHVYAVDAGSGLLTQTRLEMDPLDGEMAPVADGVLVVPGDGGPRRMLITGTVGYPVRGALRSANLFLPGPDGSLWAARFTSTDDPAPTLRWQRLDLDGRARDTVVVSGDAQGDGAGGVLDVDEQGFRRLYPAPAGPRQPGEIVATGPDGFLTRPCADCNPTLDDRAGHLRRDLPVAVPEEVSAGRLSVGNRFLSLVTPDGDDTVVRVSDVATGRTLRSFAQAGTDDDDTVWLTDRWMATVSVGQLMLYDAQDDRVVTPAFPLSSVGPLVWQSG